jgi:hypothetical protein
VSREYQLNLAVNLFYFRVIRDADE